MEYVIPSLIVIAFAIGLLSMFFFPWFMDENDKLNKISRD
jgi:hypothetical protein